MGGGYRDAEHAGEEQTEGPCQVGRKALVALQLHHVHAHGLDDLLSSHARPKPHDDTAQEHEPHRDLHAADRILAVAEGDAKEQHADKFLAVLSPVHEAHGGGAHDLGPPEEPVRPAPLHVLTKDRDGPADDPAGDKSESQAQHKAVDDLDPLRPVDAAHAALDGDGGAGYARNETVALTGRNAEDRSGHTVHHDGDEGRAQGHQSLLGIAAEVHHVAYGGCHGAVDLGHDKHTQKIEGRTHHDSRAGRQTSRRHAGGDGVGRVRPSVDEDHAQRQEQRDDKDRAAGHGIQEIT